MKILKNFLYNSAYQLLVLFLPFITMPYISRVLGPEGVGINSYTYSIVIFFTLFGSLGLSIYGSREIAFVQNDVEKRSAIFWNVFFLKGLTVLVAWLIFFVFLPVVEHHFYMYYYGQSILFLATILDVSWYFSGMEQFKTIVVRNTFLKIVTVILVFLFVRKSSDLLLYIILINTGTLVANASMVLSLKHQIIRPNLSKILSKQFLIPLLPAVALFLPNIAANVYLLLNKVMIGRLDSVTAAGFYQQSDSIIKIIVAVITSLGTVLMPRVANLYAENQNEKIKNYVHRSMNFSLAISIPMMVGIFLTSTYFVPWFFGEGYDSVITLIQLESITLVLIAVSNVLGIQFLVPTKRTRDFTLSITVGAVINIILNPLFIIKFGALGAMVATVIAELIVVLVQIFILRKVFDFSQLFAGTWKYCLCAVMMAVGILLVNYNFIFNNNWVVILIDVIVGVSLYLLSNILFKTAIVKEFSIIIHKNIGNH
ncbi:flippase [Leuconostoc carnosum]|uniref:flippase n=1 Tax=Leuconostoc carnosum TaxID=1252 RepID=UPI00123A0AE5|nr:flippase [Leuconostoc carnosum]KAA8375846.1 flippase [Leuconostoc carnosum]KAA8378510.1 flippase [Leuconostoc carnosum]